MSDVEHNMFRHKEHQEKVEFFVFHFISTIFYFCFPFHYSNQKCGKSQNSYLKGIFNKQFLSNVLFSKLQSECTIGI